MLMWLRFFYFSSSPVTKELNQLRVSYTIIFNPIIWNLYEIFTRVWFVHRDLELFPLAVPPWYKYSYWIYVWKGFYVLACNDTSLMVLTTHPVASFHAFMAKISNQ